MPIFVAIMLKHSDVLNDGERSSRNYLEKVQRCSGLVPINVFATINNRWTINATAHESWESEFLSDRIRNKAARYRSTMTEEGIIFTRAGALLNLKVLLGMQPTAVAYQKTAIGAIALHANDHVESANPSRLAKDILPAIAEFAPMWELQNIRDPANLVARYYYLYTLLQQDERMTRLFKSPIAELSLAGLNFRSYFTLLVGMFANARAGILATPCPTSIINALDIAQKAHLSTDEFTRFAASKAITPAQARGRFGPLDRETFVSRVTSNAWTSNQRPFRRQPLLELPNGDYLVLDLQFLFENASAGIPWTLMSDHLLQLRQAIGYLRAAAGLGSYGWSDAVIVPMVTTIRATHVTDLRTALNQAKAALSLAPTVYGDSSVSAGSLIKSQHIQELRDALR